MRSLIPIILLAACSTPLPERESKRYGESTDVSEPNPTDDPTQTHETVGETQTTPNTTTTGNTTGGTTTGTTTTDTTTGGTTTGGTTGGTTNPSGCPAGVICYDQFPATDSNSTVGGTTDLDSYGCDPGIDEGGPERIYRLEVDEAGLMVASLDDLGAGVDVDVHLLEDADPNTCIDRGHWDSAAWLEPGTYWAVVDSWVDGSGNAQSGDYEVTFAHTTPNSIAWSGIDFPAAEAALYAFSEAWSEGQSDVLEYGIIDFDQPSTQERFFLLDLRVSDVLYMELITHGEGSGDPNDITMASSFSNTDGSHQSSLGLAVAAETYYGSKGYSLRLDGLEFGYNSAMRDRYIVIHEADYSTQSFVNTYGYLGRSWGCPALDPAVNEDIIDILKDGGMLFSYSTVGSWRNSSAYLTGL